MREDSQLDVYKIREDFPLLKDGKLVYLDSAATTQKPVQVIERMKEFYERINANVHRGVYSLAVEATEEYEGARRKVAEFISANTWREIIFTRNTTESINLVAYSYAMRNVKRGEKIVVTEMEHHSNMVPWQMVAKEKDARVDYIPIAEDGRLRMDLLDKYAKDARIVSIVHVSNVLGTVNPVKEIVKVAKEEGAITLVDSAQGVPHMPVNVREIGCDFLAFSGHKMMGPMGIGVLYGRRELLEEMEPFMGGGEMIREVTFEGARWNEVPWKFEAGTPNVAAAVGLAAAVEYLERLGMKEIENYERRLTEYALSVLSKVPKINIIGPKDVDSRAAVISFNIADIHPHDLAEYLDVEHKIAIRAGHHCAMPLHNKLGLVASARASFYVYNTYEEVELLAEALRSALSVFKAL